MKRKLLIVLAFILPGLGNQLQAQQMKLQLISNTVSRPVKNKISQTPNAPTACTVDTIILTTQAQIDNFSTSYPACTNPKYLFINGAGATPAITNLTGLSSLTQVIKKLKISNTSITTLSALNNITLIGDTLELVRNTLLISTGLTNLTQLGALLVSNSPALNNINGISNLITSIGRVNLDTTGLINLSGLSGIQHFTSDLSIKKSPITSLSGLTNLQTIVGALDLYLDSSLTSLGIHNLTQCNAFLFYGVPLLTSLEDISHHLINKNISTFWMINTGLTNVLGLDSLKSSTNFYFWSNPSLSSLQGLAKLSGNIPFGISIHDNPLLTNITALSGITSINNATLEVDNCPLLTNLTGLGNITNIGGGLWVTNNNQIASLNFLNNGLVIHNTNNDKLKVINNPLLSVCNFPPICNYLGSNLPASISGNVPGCADSATVVVACNILCNISDSLTWNGSISNIWNDTLNWTPHRIPAACTKVIIPSGLPSFPLASNDILIGGLEMQTSNLDLGGHNLTVTKTFHLENSVILGGINITAIKIYKPAVHNSTLNGNFTCQDYSGASEFWFNTVFGNTVLSDSTGRAATSNTYLNTFNGNLSFINNSNYGQNYLSNASSSVFEFVQGNLTVINNSSANISVGLGGGRPLKVQGDFIVNSSSGLVDINNLTFVGGTFNPHTTQLGTNRIKINNLFIESGGETRLDQNVEINNSLVFDAGSNKINTNATSLLILNNGATVTRDPNNSQGFVNGPMKKTGNQAFTFPLGKYEQNADWFAPLTITAPANPTDEFTTEYFHHNAGNDGYDTALYSPGFGSVQGKEYWNLARNTGTSNVNVTLSYDGARSGPANLFNLMQVAGWNGSLWRSWSTGGFTGNIVSGTVISGIPLTVYGPLTLSFKPVRKPVITLGNLDTIHCQNTNFYVPYTLDTAMIANNLFTVQLSDTLGNFSQNPPYLGSKTTSNSDSILCFVPNFGFYGKPYKIRIVGNLPLDTSINTKAVIFKQVPQQTFNIIGANPACLGTGIQKYYPSIHEVGATYSWVLSGGGTFTTIGDTAFVNWAVTGTYLLTLTSSNQCGNGPQALATILVNPPAPTATATINNTGRWMYSSQAPPLANYNWYRNGTLISGAVTNSYYATLAGNYTVRYANFCGSSPVSNIISFAANSIPQTINFPVIPTKTYGDAPFTLSATASSALPVLFTLISGPAIVNAQTNLLTITGTGLVTITAYQPGDNIYDTAAPVTRSFTINKAAQIITFPAIANQNFGNVFVNLSAISDAGLTINYTVLSGPATVSGNLLTLTGAGAVTVRASQNGDTNYLAAAQVDRSFCTSVNSLNPISGFSNLCPATATYTVNNIPGATYFWRIAGGATLSSATNIVNINWTIPGTYSLLVSASGNCGAASANDTLVVTVINSILPDSVQSMFPPNSAVNQQLPLTLSWVPAHPESFYTFDLYVWRANLPQPSTPYAANLTSINYTLPLSSGLQYNQTYKWMVVAHNGSCIQINTGTVQQFSLIPLPDLVVQNVLAPTTAFSGQSISISWTVKNPGPGKTTTNQSWTDGVFLTFDSIPNFAIPPQTVASAWGFADFPSRPLLIAARPNVTALDSGQQYTNSVNFTLPLSYSLPLYAYVITNYPNNANAPVQVTKANDTARAPQPIVITLSPTPDLRVDTVFAPTTTFSGSTINLTYKVKNYGVVTPAGAVWTDKIYFSQSPIFNINTAIAAKLPKPNGTYYANALNAEVINNTQLPADNTYTKNVQVTVPNYIFGTYFIYVMTNATGTLYEAALNNNNLNRSQAQIFLTPTPHLTVSSLTVPVTTASTTQPIGVNWNISNTGINDNIEKNKGHYFVQNVVCASGITLHDSVGFGGSYWVDRVYLSTDSTGLNTVNAVQVNETVQGVFNSGLNVQDTLYPDFCQPLSTNPSQFNVNTVNVIKPGSNHPKTGNFNVPSNLPAGNYYVYVLANAAKTVYEYPGTPETRRSALPITIQRPDAIVSTINTPANATGGQPITITYSVLNNGPGAVFNNVRNDKIYVSTSSVFDGSAQLIDSITYTEGLPVGTAVPHTRNYTFPLSTSGTRYFYVHTNYDSSFRETNANNNISAAATTIVTSAAANDLFVSNIQMADTVFAIFPTNIKYTVANNGTGTTAGNSWFDEVYISCSPVFSPATSYIITRRSHSEIVPGGSSYSDSFNVSMQFAYFINNCFPKAVFDTAYFFVKTNTDNAVYEGSNGNNNITGTGSRVLVNPSVDLIVTSVTGPDTATVARPYLTNWTVKNIGYNPGPAGSWGDGIYFSPDSTFNSNAVLASGYFESAQLNTNQVYSDTKNAIPPNIPTGDYYVFVKTKFFYQCRLWHST